MNQMTSSNKLGWDGLAAIHYRTYHLKKLIEGQPLLNDLIRKEVGDVKGKSLAHLLCHIGSDTLSWAILGARVTGIDISSEALKYARILAEEMKIIGDYFTHGPWQYNGMGDYTDPQVLIPSSSYEWAWTMICNLYLFFEDTKLIRKWVHQYQDYSTVPNICTKKVLCIHIFITKIKIDQKFTT